MILIIMENSLILKHLINSISKIEYLNLKDQYFHNIWNFKDEAIKYCKLDCLTLYEILIKFKDLIFKEFKVDPLFILYFIRAL